MNPLGAIAFPLSVLGLAGYVISLILLGQVGHLKDDARTAAICVQTSPTVVINTATVDHNYKPYCKTGKLVLVVPKQP